VLAVYCYDIETLTDDDFLKLYASVDKDRQKKADRLKQHPAKKLSVAAGMLARFAISQHAHVPVTSVKFRNTAGGKPSADGLNIHFSISHSVGLAVCAVSDRPIGVDAEHRRVVPEDVIARCFSQGEQDYVLEEPRKTRGRFFEIWTQKEAYVKMMGTGITDFPSFDVTTKKDNIKTAAFKDYVISVATEDGASLSLPHITVVRHRLEEDGVVLYEHKTTRAEFKG